MRIYLAFGGGNISRIGLLGKAGSKVLFSYFFLQDNMFGNHDRFNELIQEDMEPNENLLDISKL